MVMPSGCVPRHVDRDFGNHALFFVSEDHYAFAQDTEFSSPSAAAAVVHGGSANGLLAWKTQDGRTLKDLEAGVRESPGS